MKAVIDSCVIFGMPLCDTLLRAAEADLYQIVLSQKILEDATRNMVLKGRLKLEKEIVIGRSRIWSNLFMKMKLCMYLQPTFRTLIL
jgi:hypothetical protein